MKDFRESLDKHIADTFELCLREGAEVIGLRNCKMIWTKNELRQEYKGVLISGFDFRINPVNGQVIAELKPPQDLSALFRKSH